MVVMRMIIGRFAHVLNSPRTLRAARRHEMVSLSDENSRGKVQNVHGGSSAINHPNIAHIYGLEESTGVWVSNCQFWR